MEDVLNRVNDFSILPTNSVENCLTLLRQLYYSRDEVPDIIRRFVGAYRQPNRRSLLVHSTSLLNNKDKTIRHIPPEMLLQLCVRWFSNLVINASMAYLEKANKLWPGVKSGSICINYATASM